MSCAVFHMPWLGSLIRQVEAVFSNEWSYELVSLPGHSERSSSKANKALCCLNSSLSPSSLAEQIHWLCPANSQLCLPSFWLTCHCVQVSSLILLVRWGWEPQQVGGAISQFPCLDRKVRVYSRQLSIFQTGFLVRKGWKLPLALAMN